MSLLLFLELSIIFLLVIFYCFKRLSSYSLALENIKLTHYDSSAEGISAISQTSSTLSPNILELEKQLLNNQGNTPNKDSLLSDKHSQVKELEDKIHFLETTLQEYEVIEEDIANIKLFKQKILDQEKRIQVLEGLTNEPHQEFLNLTASPNPPKELPSSPQTPSQEKPTGDLQSEIDKFLENFKS